MSQIASEIEVGKDCDFGYSSNLEHLSDEMKRLDLLIRLKLLEQYRPAAASDRFKGLLLSNEEIDALVSEKHLYASTAASAEKQAIITSLESLEHQIEDKKALPGDEKTRAGIYRAEEIAARRAYHRRASICRDQHNGRDCA